MHSIETLLFILVYGISSTPTLLPTNIHPISPTNTNLFAPTYIIAPTHIISPNNPPQFIGKISNLLIPAFLFLK